MALRARLSAARGAVGRHELASKLARDLVRALEALPDDTRRERAVLLADAWSKPSWWYAEARAPKRTDVAKDEANLREALTLLLELGDDAADDIAHVAELLMQLLRRCGATEAARDLVAELGRGSRAVVDACASRGLAM